MAVCLLLGYAWLFVAGIAWTATSLGLPLRDAALHGLGLGFRLQHDARPRARHPACRRRLKLRFGRASTCPCSSCTPRYPPSRRAAVRLAHARRAAPRATPWPSPFSPRSLPDRDRLAPQPPAAHEPHPSCRCARLTPRPLHSGRLRWLATGFRPFYLLASIFAALSIPLWALQFSGCSAAPYLPGRLARARDAVRLHARRHRRLPLHRRAQLDRPADARGRPLAALALLWIAARVLVLTPFADGRRGRERRLSARRGGRRWRFPSSGRQPAQLLLRRPARAARGRGRLHPPAQLGIVTAPAGSASRSRSTSCSSSSP
jgi:hypothetical protein